MYSLQSGANSQKTKAQHNVLYHTIRQDRREMFPTSGRLFLPDNRTARTAASMYERNIRRHRIPPRTKRIAEVSG